MNTENLGESELNNMLNKFIRSIKVDDNRDDVDHVTLGYNIYFHLLKPYEDRLIGKKKVFIVPHRGLHHLPWNALSTNDKNKGNKYVIDESYAVTVLPSLITFTLKYNNKDKIEPCSSLFIGPDVNDYADVLGETKKYSCGFYVKEEVSKENLLNELQQRKNVILVAHGKSAEASPFESNIQLYNEELTINDISDADINSSFVFLSGCGTGYVKRYSELKIHKQKDEYAISSR